MAERYEIYKCEICENIVEVLAGGAGALVCCGEDMTFMKANTVDASHEKHVPVPHREEHGLKVAVGEQPHPMMESHYIMCIETRVGNRQQRVYLKPGDDPAAVFCCPDGENSGERPVFRAYCNLHGLWESEG